MITSPKSHPAHTILTCLGYFEVEECEGMVNPTLGMIVNTTYTFLQKDISNWYVA